MTEIQFCYWLKGFMLSASGKFGEKERVAILKNLEQVFSTQPDIPQNNIKAEGNNIIDDYKKFHEEELYWHNKKIEEDYGKLNTRSGFYLKGVI